MSFRNKPQRGETCALKHVLNPICANASKKKRVTSHKEGENDRIFNGGNKMRTLRKKKKPFYGKMQDKQ